MARREMPRFEDWEAEKNKDAEFMAAAAELEPGYQVARRDGWHPPTIYCQIGEWFKQTEFILSEQDRRGIKREN